MRAATTLRYRDRIEQAVRLLSARLADPPTGEVLAREVGVSPYHFQRLYRAATGETVLATLNRLRAVRALELIEAGEDSITAISAAVGYETPQAFARAFRAWTGLSPSEARGEAAALKRRFSRPASPAPAAISVEIAALDPLSLTVIHTRQPIGPLNAVYEALFAAVGEAGRLDDLRGVYGVPLSDPLWDGEDRIEHLAALDIAGPPVAGLAQHAPGPGRYLRTRHAGPYEDIPLTSLSLYAHVLDADLRLAGRPALHHHLDTPGDASPEAPRTDIYLPLEDDRS